MNDYARKPEHVAQGVKRRRENRVMCSFEGVTLRDIRAKAIKEKTSVARQIRALVECGFLYLEEESKT